MPPACLLLAPEDVLAHVIVQATLGLAEAAASEGRAVCDKFFRSTAQDSVQMRAQLRYLGTGHWVLKAVSHTGFCILKSLWNKMFF